MIVEPDALLGDGDLPLDDSVEHHLRRVVRLRDGESVSATDGDGAWRLTTVRIDGSTLRLEPSTAVRVEPQRSVLVSIAAAMPKGDRLEWLVQKVTELGADRLTLLHAERSVVRWKANRIEQQRERLQRIADEACRQSRRVWRMHVEGPVDATTVLSSYAVAEPGGRRLAAGDTSIAIGPEGGWSPEELAAASVQVAINDHILRTETAAVAATALCVAFDR